MVHEGVPLSQIAIASGLPDPEETSLTEVLDVLGRLGYNTIYNNSKAWEEDWEG